MVFISYAQTKTNDQPDTGEDYRYLRKIVDYFDGIPDENVKKLVWYDGKIPRAGNWEAIINKKRAEARVAILLVSVKSLKSDFIRDKELNYFLQKGIPIYWFLLDNCAWQETGLVKDQCASKRQGLNLETLEELDLTPEGKVIIGRIIKEVCDEIYKDHIKNFDSFYLLQPRDVLYKCNRNDELYLFNNCYFSYVNNCNTIFFSISGDTQDQLPTFPKSILQKSLNKTGFDVVPVAVKDPLSVAMRNSRGPKACMIDFKKALLDQMPEEVSFLTPGLNLITDIPEQQDRKIMLLLSVHITSTSFHQAGYESVINWLRNDVCNLNKDRAGYKILFLFTFQYSGDEAKDAALKQFIAMGTQCFMDVPTTIRTDDGLPDKYEDRRVLHLGDHKVVEEDSIIEWFNDQEFDTGIYYNNIKNKLTLPTRMKPLEDELTKFIDQYNKQHI